MASVPGLEKGDPYVASDVYSFSLVPLHYNIQDDHSIRAPIKWVGNKLGGIRVNKPFDAILIQPVCPFYLDLAGLPCHLAAPGCPIPEDHNQGIGGISEGWDSLKRGN